jgi:hypothetical protein
MSLCRFIGGTERDLKLLDAVKIRSAQIANLVLVEAVEIAAMSAVTAPAKANFEDSRGFRDVRGSLEQRAGGASITTPLSLQTFGVSNTVTMLTAPRLIGWKSFGGEQ